MIFDIDTPDNLVVELDADSLVYRLGYAVDMMDAGPQLASGMLDKAIEAIYEDTKCSKCNIYVGTHTNYRDDIAKIWPYKGNRARSRRPMYYDAIRSRLLSQYGAMLVYGEEAEDRVGICAYTYDNFDEFIIGAIDKDMNMIAGMHYNYVTHSFQYWSKIEAMRAFYLQLVTGDTTDNIPGLYHMLEFDGEKDMAHKFRYSKYKSKLIIELNQMRKEHAMWQHVLKMYTDYGQVDKHGITRIIEIARLLWIRRKPDELWVPPTERKFDYITNDKRKEITDGN